MSRRLPDPPTRSQCLMLMEEYDMLPNIREHSLMVCRVSLSIGKDLVASGVAVDMPLIEAAALLHDITKTQSIETRENHARTGEELLVRLGCPKTGRAVGEHIIPDDRGERLTEAEVVAYADKRVLHDSVVELDERFVYLLETYGSHPEARAYFDEMRRRMNRIEELLLEVTGVAPASGF